VDPQGIDLTDVHRSEWERGRGRREGGEGERDKETHTIEMEREIRWPF
jgi:hypothetical protein